MHVDRPVPLAGEGTGEPEGRQDDGAAGGRGGVPRGRVTRRRVPRRRVTRLRLSRRRRLRLQQVLRGEGAHRRVLAHVHTRAHRALAVHEKRKQE